MIIALITNIYCTTLAQNCGSIYYSAESINEADYDSMMNNNNSNANETKNADVSRCAATENESISHADIQNIVNKVASIQKITKHLTDKVSTGKQPTGKPPTGKQSTGKQIAGNERGHKARSIIYNNSLHSNKPANALIKNTPTPAPRNSYCPPQKVNNTNQSASSRLQEKAPQSSQNAPSQNRQNAPSQNSQNEQSQNRQNEQSQNRQNEQSQNRQNELRNRQNELRNRQNTNETRIRTQPNTLLDAEQEDAAQIRRKNNGYQGGRSTLHPIIEETTQIRQKNNDSGNGSDYSNGPSREGKLNKARSKSVRFLANNNESEVNQQNGNYPVNQYGNQYNNRYDSQYNNQYPASQYRASQYANGSYNKPPIVFTNQYRNDTNDQYHSDDQYKNANKPPIIFSNHYNNQHSNNQYSNQYPNNQYNNQYYNGQNQYYQDNQSSGYESSTTQKRNLMGLQQNLSDLEENEPPVVLRRSVYQQNNNQKKPRRNNDPEDGARLRAEANKDEDEENNGFQDSMRKWVDIDRKSIMYRASMQQPNLLANQSVKQSVPNQNIQLNIGKPYVQQNMQQNIPTPYVQQSVQQNMQQNIAKPFVQQSVQQNMQQNISKPCIQQSVQQNMQQNISTPYVQQSVQQNMQQNIAKPCIQQSVQQNMQQNISKPYVQQNMQQNNNRPEVRRSILKNSTYTPPEVQHVRVYKEPKTVKHMDDSDSSSNETVKPRLSVIDKKAVDNIRSGKRLSTDMSSFDEDGNKEGSVKRRRSSSNRNSYIRNSTRSSYRDNVNSTRSSVNSHRNTVRCAVLNSGNSQSNEQGDSLTKSIESKDPTKGLEHNKVRRLLNLETQYTSSDDEKGRALQRGSINMEFKTQQLERIKKDEVKKGTVKAADTVGDMCVFKGQGFSDKNLKEFTGFNEIKELEGIKKLETIDRNIAELQKTIKFGFFTRVYNRVFKLFRGQSNFNARIKKLVQNEIYNELKKEMNEFSKEIRKVPIIRIIFNANENEFVGEIANFLSEPSVYNVIKPMRKYKWVRKYIKVAKNSLYSFYDKEFETFSYIFKDFLKPFVKKNGFSFQKNGYSVYGNKYREEIKSKNQKTVHYNTDEFKYCFISCSQKECICNEGDSDLISRFCAHAAVFSLLFACDIYLFDLSYSKTYEFIKKSKNNIEKLAEFLLNYEVTDPVCYKNDRFLQYLDSLQNELTSVRFLLANKSLNGKQLYTSYLIHVEKIDRFVARLINYPGVWNEIQSE